MMTAPPNPQVLIIGGGIVGLSTSLFLSSQGLTSLLVERRAQTSTHPRSRSVNSRTMELYRSLGIDAEVRAAGASLAPSKGIYRGTSLVEVIGSHKRGEENYERLMRISGMLMEMLGPVDRARGTQDCVEPVLLAAARERQGADVRFGVECLGFEQDINGVMARLRERETGFETAVRAEYLIAADGAGSPTRRTLGVKSSGAGKFGYLLNILFQADLAAFVKGRNFSLCQIERHEVRGLFTSINNSDRWVFHLSYDPSKGQTPDDFPPEKCEQLIRIALGMPDIEMEIESILPWESSVHYVEQMQHGRVFLAGDAAHVMPPWGGQGANSGIADVHNLTWKLAAVIKGQAPRRLLATYDAERLPVDRLVADESGRQCDEVGLIDMKRTLKAVVALVRRVPRVLGYGYKYTSEAIEEEDGMPWYCLFRWVSQFVGCVFRICGEAGTRVPHLLVQREGETISTLDLCGLNFALYAGRDGHAWVKAAPKVAPMLGVELKAYRIGPTSELVCGKGLWESKAGISTRGALLVRPDGFVAWRSWAQPVDLYESLENVMLKALCR